MAQKLGDLAQNFMDLYYQQYKSDEDFFELYHFKYVAYVVFCKVLQEEYEKSYKLALGEEGRGEAQLNPDWYVTQEFEVMMSEIGDRQINFSTPPFQFRFDKQSSGIQNIFPFNKKCGEFIRTTVDEVWKIRNAPKTSVIWWHVLGNSIMLYNINCGLKKVRLSYIPSLVGLDDDAPISEAVQEDILRRGLELMFAARNGNVIDTSSLQTPNKVIETEINNAFKNLKTNP